jgi:putative transcriptional regulator
MNITHHPSDELMLDYASGALSEGWALAVATHLSMCDSSSGLLRGIETIGGILLDEADEACISENMFGSILDKIDIDRISSPEQKEPVNAKKFGSIVPQPLATYVGNDLEALAWKNLGLGVRHLPIELSDRATSARLISIPAGKPVPEHSHSGRELTVVLSGGFHDVTGEYGPGDIQEAYGDLEHQPHARDAEDCIALAITDAPLRFSGIAARLVQPFFKI